MRWALCCQVQNSKPSKDARTPIFYAFHRNGLLGQLYSPSPPPPPQPPLSQKEAKKLKKRLRDPLFCSLTFSLLLS